MPRKTGVTMRGPVEKTMKVPVVTGCWAEVTRHHAMMQSCSVWRTEAWAHNLCSSSYAWDLFRISVHISHSTLESFRQHFSRAQPFYFGTDRAKRRGDFYPPILGGLLFMFPSSPLHLVSVLSRAWLPPVADPASRRAAPRHPPGRRPPAGH